MDTCAVCGMELELDDPPITAEFDGQTYAFCSEECREEFEAEPEAYANPMAA